MLALVHQLINTPAPAPVNKASVMLAKENIKAAPAIRVTNTLAPVPATPAVPALLVTVNIPLVPAPAAISGKKEVVR